MAWLREQRLRSLSTSSAGMLMTDKSYAEKAAVPTGEDNDGVVLETARAFQLLLL